VYALIPGMLQPLGDPFTRFLPPRTADAFENQREGRASGSQLAPAPASRPRLPCLRCLRWLPSAPALALAPGRWPLAGPSGAAPP
jgi:hypothetical protein